MGFLVIVRHGQSAYNLENRFTGELDIPLTDQGRQEARDAAMKIKNRNIAFDHAFTSALTRAHQTLSIILDVLGIEGTIPVDFSKALNERNYGELQGLNKTETAAKFSAEQVHAWRRKYYERPPGGESLADTFNRVLPYYEKNIVPVLAAEKNILIVAHGNSLRALMMYLEKINETDIEHVEIATGKPRFYQLNAAMQVVEVGYL
jgi:2,3-bisphosphoglycerate-dependent phosphoglycerate mutase